MEITKCPEGSASIMWAWGRSCPLKAKLTAGGAFLALGVGPTFPTSIFKSLAGPSRPSARIGNTAIEPPGDWATNKTFP